MRRAIGAGVTALGHPSSLLPGPPRPPRIAESGPRDSLSKVMKLPALEKRIARHRAQGERVVHCHGCFDVVHPGHLRYLQFARTQGDILVVSLTSDDAIEKEDGIRPHVPQELRAETLAAVELVDYVVIAEQQTAEPVIALIKPDIYVKGKEYDDSSHAGFLAERRLVENLGGRVVFSSGDVVFSSTKLLDLNVLGDDGVDELTRLRVCCQRWGIDRPTLLNLVDSLRGQRVMVVGDAINDRYVYCAPKDVASEAPVLGVTALEQVDYLGGAAIIAAHLRGLGAEPHLVTTVGSDELSANMVAELEAQGITVTAFPGQRRLPNKVRYLVGEQKLFKVDDAEARPADSDRERRVLGLLADRRKWVDAVIFSDFGYGTLTTSLVKRAMESLHGHVKTVAGDVSGASRTLLAYRGAELLTPTEKELRAVTGDFESSLPAIAMQVMHDLGVGNMIVKMGGRGAVMFSPREADRERWFQSRLRSEYLPSLATRVVDPMGAGDALLSAATMARVAGASLPTATYLGSAAASIGVSRLGNVAITMPGLKRWLAARPELLP
jgi:rfaE bifunctional protein kinase chain/domain/rfaE bifunctional protein nucleotidyltransferase chain/domain